MTGPGDSPDVEDRDPPDDRIVIDASDLTEEPPQAAAPGLPGSPRPPTGPPVGGASSPLLPPLAPTSGETTGAVRPATAMTGPTRSIWSRVAANRLSSAVLAGLIGGLLGMLLGELVAGPDSADRGGSDAAGPPGFTEDGSSYNGIALGTGDVQVSLTWDSTDDLDLHVVDPSGDEIFYGDPISSSGGELDVDSNAACDQTSTTPVENVFWPDGGSPTGHYQVQVRLYQECGGDGATQDFSVTIRLGGIVTDTFDGTVTEHQTVTVTEFDR